MRDNPPQRTTEFLRQVLHSFKGQNQVSLGALLKALEHKGFVVLIMIFDLPNLIPVPGLTMVLSIPVIFFSFQMMMGLRSPWLPKWINQKVISYNNLETIFNKVCYYLEKVEHYIKPRLTFLTEGKKGESITGFLCLILAVIFFLPIPLGNFFPVLAVLIISIGFFNNDGLTILLGTLCGIIGIIIASAVVIFGKVIIMQMYHYLGF